MQSTTEQRTLLEWMPKHDGSPLQPEAQQQQRFVEIGHLFVAITPLISYLALPRLDALFGTY